MLMGETLWRRCGSLPAPVRVCLGRQRPGDYMVTAATAQRGSVFPGLRSAGGSNAPNQCVCLFGSCSERVESWCGALGERDEDRGSSLYKRAAITYTGRGVRWSYV
jgi:hypothetical protein